MSENKIMLTSASTKKQARCANDHLHTSLVGSHSVVRRILLYSKTGILANGFICFTA